MGPMDALLFSAVLEDPHRGLGSAGSLDATQQR